jgi:hypothetical protein
VAEVAEKLHARDFKNASYSDHNQNAFRNKDLSSQVSCPRGIYRSLPAMGCNGVVKSRTLRGVPCWESKGPNL